MYKIIGLIIAVIASVFLWFHGCIYLAIAAHTLYPDSEYGVALNKDTGIYHAYLFIDGEAKDPQLLFLRLEPDVDYYNPELRTKSTSELLNRTYTFFPSK